MTQEDREGMSESCYILQALLGKIFHGESLNAWEEATKRIQLDSYFEFGDKIGASRKVQILKLLRFKDMRESSVQ